MLKPIFYCALVLMSIGGNALAQEIQSDGTMMYGGIRLNPDGDSVGEQTERCRDPLTQAAGILAMNFYGVDPWITEHPELERNCATLLDIAPVANAPQIAELRASVGGWWSRVTRIRIPENAYGWNEALGFGWCSDQTCSRQLLLIFTATDLVGYCSANPGTNSGTRYALGAPGGTEAWTYTTEYKSCFDNPGQSVSFIAGSRSAEGAEKFLPPQVDRTISDYGSTSSDPDQMMEIMRSNQSQLAADAARRAAEEQRAAAAFESMRTPNAIGW